MLCENTPDGNEHVDSLITKIMQKCESKDIDRLVADFRIYKETINDRTEARYNPMDKGINWQKFAGRRTTSEPVPINLRRRERVLADIFKGMIRNPNIKINQILILLRLGDVTQNFIDTQFDLLQHALLKDECAFSRKELIEASKKYIGIETEKLEEMLDAADKRRQNKTINPADAAKSALQDSTLSAEDMNQARGKEETEKIEDKNHTK